MKGAELAAKYAFPPNRHGYCGKSTFRKVLSSYLAGKTRTKPLKDELKKFKAHYRYLSLIAKENNKKPFDLEVVRAFWTGGRLLDRISQKTLRRFVEHDLFGSRQKKRAKTLAENLPKGILAHHSFNSLYINFVTGKAERSMKNFDSCCITYGKILSVSKSTAVVMRHSIDKKDGIISIKSKKERIALERNGVRFIGALRAGDIVSVHWGMAIEKLGPKELRALKHYTKKNLDALNNRY